ncbi:ZPR1 zinc-finger domain-domain-containing protein [Catenaria anguillulae PL171]|uniref:ZPR1 zinc-finger domain-domain-containing protein n=1 Tax=Catenaria anguillulae PL171 TaxID=765915 RepID=A0A1Y2HVN7_9FUNG|nr:ZPR1 zinc-finger domain-domain-containing protein [Catenaria anguillulae PL171]
MTKKNSTPRRPTPRHKLAKSAAAAAKPASTSTSSSTDATAVVTPTSPTTTETANMTAAVPEPTLGAVPMSLARPCPNCGVTTEAMAVLTRLPFWDRDLAATRHSCHACRNVCTKYTVGTQPTHPKGQKTTLRLRRPSDLDRDLLKSEFATLSIARLGLTLSEDAMCGTLCTVRELLTFVRGDVAGNYARALAQMDEQSKASEDPQMQALEHFLSILSGILALEAGADAADAEANEDLFIAAGLATEEEPLTVELEDPAGNSFIKPKVAPPALDQDLVVVEFERTEEIKAKFGFES